MNPLKLVADESHAGLFGYAGALTRIDETVPERVSCVSWIGDVELFANDAVDALGNCRAPKSVFVGAQFTKQLLRASLMAPLNELDEAGPNQNRVEWDHSPASGGFHSSQIFFRF